MGSAEANSWNEDEGILLGALLDTIIPSGRGGELPAAGALGVADFLATRVKDTEGLGDHIANLLKTLSAVTVEHGSGPFHNLDAATREDLAKKVEARLPEAFKLLVVQTYTGYYTRPEVTVHFGTGPYPPHPHGHELPPDDPEDLKSLLEPVRMRGKCYRDC